jgi:prepilin-type N-terminal cleavage/methylation domain-containing protein
MLQRIKQARKNESGFTLIELLLVIVILGVLSGIVVFAVGGINNRGEVAACKADLKTVEIAQEAHFAKSTPGSYAVDAAALVAAGLLKDTPTWVTTNNTGAVTKIASAPTGC